MADETKQIDVLMGPYRGHRLTVSSADATSAINNHWATDPDVLPDVDHPHPPLSEEERVAALAAATTWAQAQWDAAQQVPPPDPPPEGGETPLSRDMTPESSGGTYERRAPGRPPKPRAE